MKFSARAVKLLGFEDMAYTAFAELSSPRNQLQSPDSRLETVAEPCFQPQPADLMLV